MCGIFVSSSNEFNNEEKLNIARSYLQKRGPDSSNILIIKDKISFVHTRLAIQDQSDFASQPMYSSNKNFIVVYNGEIYNKSELDFYLKEIYDLELKTNCDTETLIEGFCYEGVNFIEKIDGIYAFIIYDIENEQFFASRDLYGVKPLLYSCRNDGILFSSDVRSLFYLLDKPLPLNKSIIDLLSLSFVPEPSTLFREIKHLEPGIVFKYDLSGNIINTYKINGNFNTKKFKGENFKESIQIADKLLKESIKKQTIADKEVGIFLSSGLDSSLIFSYLMAMKYEIFFALTLIWKPLMNSNDFQQAENKAKTLSSHLGYEKHLEISPPSKIRGLEKILSYMVIEGLTDPAALSTYYLSKKARNLGCKVMLCGQGADEIFYGYRRHKVIPIYFLISKFKSLNNLFSEKILRFIKIPTIYRIVRRLIKLSSLFGLSKKAFIKNIYSLSSDSLISKLLNNFELSTLDKELNSIKYDNLISHETIEYLDTKFDLKSLNLRYADKMGMATSIEIRVPFLSNKLVKYIKSLPRNYKFRLFEGKRILKQIAKKLLPNFIIKRSKTGFTFPLEEILIQEKEFILELVNKENIIFNKYFNYYMVKKYFDSFYNGESINTQMLFSLISIKICLDDLYL